MEDRTHVITASVTRIEHSRKRAAGVTAQETRWRGEQEWMKGTEGRMERVVDSTGWEEVTTTGRVGRGDVRRG